MFVFVCVRPQLSIFSGAAQPADLHLLFKGSPTWIPVRQSQVRDASVMFYFYCQMLSKSSTVCHFYSSVPQEQWGDKERHVSSRCGLLILPDGYQRSLISTLTVLLTYCLYHSHNSKSSEVQLWQMLKVWIVGRSEILLCCDFYIVQFSND